MSSELGPGKHTVQRMGVGRLQGGGDGGRGGQERKVGAGGAEECAWSAAQPALPPRVTISAASVLPWLRGWGEGQDRGSARPWPAPRSLRPAGLAAYETPPACSLEIPQERWQLLLSPKARPRGTAESHAPSGQKQLLAAEGRRPSLGVPRTARVVRTWLKTPESLQTAPRHCRAPLGPDPRRCRRRSPCRAQSAWLPRLPEAGGSGSCPGPRWHRSVSQAPPLHRCLQKPGGGQPRPLPLRGRREPRSGASGQALPPAPAGLACWVRPARIGGKTPRRHARCCAGGPGAAQAEGAACSPAAQERLAASSREQVARCGSAVAVEQTRATCTAWSPRDGD